jgi:hypothetical protein
VANQRRPTSRYIVEYRTPKAKARDWRQIGAFACGGIFASSLFSMALILWWKMDDLRAGYAISLGAALFITVFQAILSALCLWYASSALMTRGYVHVRSGVTWSILGCAVSLLSNGLEPLLNKWHGRQFGTNWGSTVGWLTSVSAPVLCAALFMRKRSVNS